MVCVNAHQATTYFEAPGPSHAPSSYFGPYGGGEHTPIMIRESGPDGSWVRLIGLESSVGPPAIQARSTQPVARAFVCVCVWLRGGEPLDSCRAGLCTGIPNIADDLRRSSIRENGRQLSVNMHMFVHCAGRWRFDGSALGIARKILSQGVGASCRDARAHAHIDACRHRSVLVRAWGVVACTDSAGDATV